MECEYLIISICAGIISFIFILLFLYEIQKNKISRECIRILFAQAGKALFYFDPKKRKIIPSEGFETVFGSQIAGAFNFYESVSNLIYPEDKVKFDAEVETILSGKDISDFRFRIYTTGISEIWCSLTTLTIKNRRNHPVLHIASLANIDKQVRKEENLRFKSERDSLTSLYNKLTTEMLITSILIDRKYKKTASALFMIDIDNLKYINDTYGHVCGDRIIIRLANCIRMLFRESDILGRVGGDEFIVFMKDCGTTEDICTKAQRLCASYHSSYNFNGTAVSLSCSIGISLFPQHAQNFLDLYEDADKTLYAVKRSGKNKFSLFDPLLTD